METSFNLGLIQDRELGTLYIMMKQGTSSFQNKPGGLALFQSLADVIRTEMRRRRQGTELDERGIDWSVETDELHPVSAMCLQDFFRRKIHEFEDSPPVSRFFRRIQQSLSAWINDHIAPSLQRTIREQQLKTRTESSRV